MSQPRALTCVLKGLAVPPPYCGWMTGVRRRSRGARASGVTLFATRHRGLATDLARLERSLGSDATVLLLGAPGTGNAGRALYLNGLTNLNTDINSYQPYADLRYDGLQTQVRARLRSLQAGVSYTLSKTTNYSDNGGGNLIAGATDPEGDTLTIYSFTQLASHYGSLNVTLSTGDFTFTPQTGWYGSTTTSFWADDGPGAALLRRMREQKE